MNKTRKTMIKNLKLIIACVILLLLPINQLLASDYIDKNTGVSFVWKDEKLNKIKQRNIETSEISSKNRRRLVRVIKNELKKYPKESIKAVLDTVYLVKGIKINHSKVSGLAHPRAIILGQAGKHNIRKVAHHEIAHLFYRHYNFPYKKEWTALNPKGFKYVGSGLKAIESGYSKQRLGRKSVEEGFISTYARSSVEEDFAEVAEALFTGNSSIRNKIRNNKTLAAKADIVRKFYKSISPKILKEMH